MFFHLLYLHDKQCDNCSADSYIFRLNWMLDGNISYIKSCDHMFDMPNMSLVSTKANNIVQITFLYFRIILIDSTRYMIVKCDTFGNSIHN